MIHFDIPQMFVIEKLLTFGAQAHESSQSTANIRVSCRSVSLRRSAFADPKYTV